MLINFRVLLFRLDRREVRHHARRKIAVFEPVEDLVDGSQGLKLDIGFYFASDSEGEGLGHILPGTDERTADGDAVRHHIKERNWKFARRQSDQDTSTTLSGHADASLECDERRRGNQNPMSPAAGRLIYRSCRIPS